MDIYVFNGLPVHVLLVHFVVVLVPATALCAILTSVWPTARRRLGIVTAILGAVVIALVPVTAQAGQWLKDRVPNTPLIDTHAALGGSLWPWSLALGIIAIALWLWYFILARRGQGKGPGASTRRFVSALLILAAVVVGGYATVLTIQIGEAGSRAIWQNSFSETPLP